MTIEAATVGLVTTVEYPLDCTTTETVRPKGVGCTSGQWYCTTHGLAFENNLMKDVHCREDQTHVLAWNCLEHGGLEVP